MASVTDGGSPIALESPPSPEWDDVRAFLAVVRTGTLPGAAGLLGVSAVTVGRRIQALEATLGIPLFDRLPNRLDLTEAGQRLATAGNGMDQAAAACMACAARLAAPEDTPVRVSATASVTLFLATHASRLSTLLGSRPVQVEVVTTRARQDPGSGDADLALRMRRLPDNGPLAARKVGRVAFGVYAACEVTPGKVIGLPRTERVRSQSGWLEAFAVARELPVRLRMADVAARHRAVRDGAGASLLPCFLGDADDRLTRIGEPPVELVEDVFVVRHELARAVVRARTVMTALETLFSDHAAALRGEIVR